MREPRLFAPYMPQESSMKSFRKSPNVRTHITRARAARMIIALAFAGVSATACKNDSTDPGRLLTLVVSPNPTTVAPNGTVQFTAVGTDPTRPFGSRTGGGPPTTAPPGLSPAGGRREPSTTRVRPPGASFFGPATVPAPSPAAPIINLRTASTYGILAGSTVTCASAPGTV